MPWQEGTLTDDDVAQELGVAVDGRVTAATDAARSWAQAWVTSVEPALLWSDADRHRGGVWEACYQYNLRADPQGMPAYEDAGISSWQLHAEAKRLLRPDLGVS